MARRGDGLFLRGKTWWLDFQHDHTRHTERLGRNISLAAAREIATVKRSAILRAEAGIGTKPKDVLFDEAAESFLKWCEANKRSRTTRNYRLCITQLAKSFNGKQLSKIGSFMIEKHKFARKGSPVRANRELQTLRRLFYWSMGQTPPLYDGSNPMKKTKNSPTFFEESEGRTRFLEPQESDKLLAAAKEPLRSMIVLAINAGVRLHSEALTLQWPNVDLDRNTITILSAYAKNKKTRRVPLNEPASEALARLKVLAKGPFVFEKKKDGSPYRSIRTAFEKACKDAGLADVTPHVLRHTFATRLVDAGVNFRLIQELGGWKSVKMVERYSHTSERGKADAVQRLAEFHNTGHNTDREAVAIVG